MNDVAASAPHNLKGKRPLSDAARPHWPPCVLPEHSRYRFGRGSILPLACKCSDTLDRDENNELTEVNVPSRKVGSQPGMAAQDRKNRRDLALWLSSCGNMRSYLVDNSRVNVSVDRASVSQQVHPVTGGMRFTCGDL